MNDKKVMHAWWSNQSQELGLGTCFYRREDGSEVEVCFVADDVNWSKETGYTDMKYLGEVTEWVRCGRPFKKLWRDS